MYKATMRQVNSVYKLEGLGGQDMVVVCTKYIFINSNADIVPKKGIRKKYEVRTWGPA